MTARTTPGPRAHRGTPEPCGAFAAQARITSRQLESLCYGLSGELFKLRDEARRLDMALDQYLREVILHRDAEQIQKTVAAEQPETAGV